MDTTPQDLREQAADLDRRASESFDRCDTDGFVSQWALGLTAQELRLQADIDEAGGVAEFLALFTVDGEWVPAKRIETQYGSRWMVLDRFGNRTGEFLPFLPKRRRTLADKGYLEGRVLRPAKATIVGSGHGLAGATSCRAARVPTDRDWDRPAEVVCTDRWADDDDLG